MNKKFQKTKNVIGVLFAAIALWSCDEQPEKPVETPVKPGSHGVFILNQGGYNTNDASLLYYNFETEELSSDLLNGNLGATGQDMLIYGGKLYISVSGSSNITVLDVQNHELIKRIGLFTTQEVPRTPRYLEAYNGKIYASCFDGTVIELDTTQLEVKRSVAVGEFPEGIVAYNGKLYVANSGGQSANGPHKTLSIIDITSFEEIKRIEVGPNPYIVKSDGEGNLYLSYQGNWNDVPGGFQKINTNNEQVSEIGQLPKQDFVIENGFVWFYDVDYTLVSTGEGKYGKYNLKTQAFSDILENSKEIKNTPYGIGVNPYNHDIYIADTDWFNPGNVTIFDHNGQKKQVLEHTGINPCKFAFY
ncbi:MAG: hypothetical protein LBS25_02915 [Candidatus Symbiothrix sp.]|jgi:hypothetical protein|nr:hypothetical protein [Candidatus Symbiothrix sp.]